MRAGRRTRLAAWTIVSLFFGMQTVQSATDLGTVSATQPLFLPLDLSNLDGDLAIELGTTDITAFARLENDQVFVDVSSFAETGVQTLTVYLFQGESATVLAEFRINLSGTSGQSTSYSVQATHEVTARTVNGDVETDASSSRTLTAEGDRISAEVSYVISSRPIEQIDGQSVNLSQYTLQYQNQFGQTGVSAVLGHQTLNFDPLLVGSFTRRGASAGLSFWDDRLSFEAFSLRSSDALGGENITGLADDEDRVSGLGVKVQPFAQNDLAFSLQIIDGQGGLDGALVAGRGSGISTGFDGSLRDGRLRYGAHIAQVDWDEDAGGPLDAVTAKAYDAYVAYDLISDADTGRQLVLGFNYRAADADYFSLANPGLPVGEEEFALTADYSFERLWLSGTLSNRRTNFNGPSDLTTDDILRFETFGSYTLDAGRLFENRSLTFGGHIETWSRVDTPLAQPIEDYTDIGLNVGLDVSNTDTTGSFSFNYLHFDDQSAFNADETRLGPSAFVSHQVSNRLSVTGTVTLEWIDGDLGNFFNHSVSTTVDYQTEGPWNFGVEFNGTASDDPFIEEGILVAASATRPIGDLADLVLFASYGNGPYATESGTDADAIVGLQLRASTSAFR